MDLAQMKLDKRLTSVHVRIPFAMKEKAKEVAASQSTNEVKVTEADIYRAAIEIFLLSPDTKCIHNEKQNVSDKGGDAK